VKRADTGVAGILEIKLRVRNRVLEADYYARRVTEKKLVKKKKRGVCNMPVERAALIAAALREGTRASVMRDLPATITELNWVYGEMCLGRFGGL
jgi:hypothetical protein